jgi:hypothetical protein
MKRKSKVAAIVQGLGLGITAGGVGLISHWGGVVTFGVGTIILGIAIELDDR